MSFPGEGPGGLVVDSRAIMALVMDHDFIAFLGKAVLAEQSDSMLLTL